MQNSSINTHFNIQGYINSCRNAAEKYVDLCADIGSTDEAFRDALGSDANLDKAIGYYLEEDVDVDEDEVEEY